MTELLRELKNAEKDIAECKIKPEHLGQMVMKIEDGSISGAMGKQVFKEMFETGTSPDEIIKSKGMTQLSDTSAIEGIIDEIINSHPDEVSKYRGGKAGLFGFFVGQAMARTKGQANPKIVNELLKKKLGPSGE
jgi:aspartyl-tRNA(Asn)/glutamyl-tRNA(Gln) amidotransferase subunit B